MGLEYILKSCTELGLKWYVHTTELYSSGLYPNYFSDVSLVQVRVATLQNNTQLVASALVPFFSGAKTSGGISPGS